MKLLHKLPKAVWLLLLLAGTLTLDFFMYSFLAACPACANFSQFITTQSALSAPLIASFSALFSLTSKHK